VDDVNDMNESSGIVERALASSMRRRDFLTKAAAAGTIAWATPVILSQPAYAADGGGGTPGCRPTFTIACQVHSCDQGSKMFPGFTVTTTPCPCSTTVPPQRPTTCIKITNITACGNNVPNAYGNGTDCSPLQQHPNQPDVLLSTGNWVCFDPNQPVFFGNPRNGNGAINNLANCTFSFRVGIWAGGCLDRDGTPSFTCQTFNVTVVWSGANGGSVTCTPTAAPADQSLCTNVPPEASPCGTCP
jgi:hypothetical protein